METRFNLIRICADQKAITGNILLLVSEFENHEPPTPIPANTSHLVVELKIWHTTDPPRPKITVQYLKPIVRTNADGWIENMGRFSPSSWEFSHLELENNVKLKLEKIIIKYHRNLMNKHTKQMIPSRTLWLLRPKSYTRVIIFW